MTSSAGTILLEGSLDKKGSGFPFKWQERTFKLYPSLIEYYKGTELKGSLQLTKDSLIKLENLPLHDFAFSVATGDNSLLMTGKDNSVREMWHNAVTKAVGQIGTSASASASASTGTDQVPPQTQPAANFAESGATAALPKLGLCQVFYLKDINSVNQSYLVDLSFIFHWRPDDNAREAILEQGVKERTKLETAPYGKPSFVICEVNESTTLTEEYFYDPATDTCFGNINWLIDVANVMDFRLFPVDNQELELVCEVPGFILEQFDSSLALPHEKLDVGGGIYFVWRHDSWKIQGVKCALENATTTSPNGVSCCDGRVVVTVTGDRQPAFYIYNVVVVLYLITVCAFSVCAMDTTDFASRISLISTLLLTVVAFKLVINTFVPAVAYLTLLDQYIIVSLVVLVGSVAECFLISFVSVSNAAIIDQSLNALGAILWSLFNVVAVVAAQAGWLNSFMGKHTVDMLSTKIIVTPDEFAVSHCHQ